jgi:methylase of polypeptide subunit release factors
MSRAGRILDRRPDDHYVTPRWAVEALLAGPLGIEEVRMTGDVLDPCAGSGAILKALGANSYKVRGIELDEQRAREVAAYANCEQGDSLKTVSWGAPDAVVMNPPYLCALEFVTKALKVCHLDNPHTKVGGVVAVLLRLQWLSSQKRAAFHRDHPADILVLPRRPSFTMDGKTDAADYAWFVWGPGRGNRWAILNQCDVVVEDET